jgi:hypothetical protein
MTESDPAAAAPASADAYQPYVPPPSTVPQAVMRPLGLAGPAALACRRGRFRAAPGIGLFYGACFWGMALVLGLVFRSRPEYVMSIASGCLLLGPFLAMGLYEVSRRREAGERPTLGASATCWSRTCAAWRCWCWC